MTDASRWKATVHVGGLASQVTAANIHDAFIPFGFAYVEFEDVDDAKEAIDNMDQSELFGRILRVSAAKPPKSANEGLGSKTAVWAQETWLAEHAAGEEDRAAGHEVTAATGDDPMQGLEGLDVAGPKPA